VFFQEDGLVGIDLDDCRDPETGALRRWARRVIKKLKSYAEVSPSGTGVKIWLRGKLPGPCRRKKLERSISGKRVCIGEIEVYDQKTIFYGDGAPPSRDNRRRLTLASTV